MAGGGATYDTVDSPGGPTMATKFAVDGPGGSILEGPSMA